MRRLDPADLTDQFADRHLWIDNASRARIYLAAECWNLGRKLERRADGLPPCQLAVGMLRAAVQLLDTSLEILETNNLFPFFNERIERNGNISH